MSRTYLTSRRAGWLGRVALTLGVACAIAGGVPLGAGPARAAVGKNLGAVSLNSVEGPTSVTPTWFTGTACPAGFQGSAVFSEVHSDGTTTSSISAPVNSVTAPFSGTLLASIAQVQAGGGIPDGGTQELVVICFSGPDLTGNSDPEMYLYVFYSPDGSTYLTSTVTLSGFTTTTLSASPDPADAGQAVTLTATVTAGDGSHPAGSVQFQVGNTAVGPSVAVGVSGVATTTTTFAAAGPQPLSAVFTPADAASYHASTGTYTETVQVRSGSEPLAVTVPPSGSFTLTVSAGTVNLTGPGLTVDGLLNPITVSDTRNSYPGWSVSGQAASFTGSGTAAGGVISGDQLGWVPAGTTLGDGVTLGPGVAAGSGLGTTAAVLASAQSGHGFGTSVLGAILSLDIPPLTLPGPYSGTLTVTALTSLP
jgi:Bacterial Ig-like domain (group 3)